jgi:hypothetical protein
VTDAVVAMNRLDLAGLDGGSGDLVEVAISPAGADE